MTNIIQMLALE